MSTKTATKSRGSDLMKNQYTERDIETLLAVGDAEGINLVDFFPTGIPAPDGSWGVWHVKRENLGALLDRLTRLEHVPVFKVFPKGIPAADLFEVVFEAGSQRRY
jgi:hypothetical protein